MTNLPQHPAEYESVTVVHLKCPREGCELTLETEWDALELGSEHRCVCGYHWKIGNPGGFIYHTPKAIKAGLSLSAAETWATGDSLGRLRRVSVDITYGEPLVFSKPTGDFNE